MTAPLVTPLEARCKVCGDTGSMSLDIDGHQDCTACDAVERRAELNNYLSGLSPFISLRATAWCAYDFGMRRPVAAQPSAAARIASFYLAEDGLTCTHDVGECKLPVWCKDSTDAYNAMRIVSALHYRANLPSTAPPSAGSAAKDAQDAALWRAFEKALRNRRIPGPAHGRRFKIVEICPMSSDETEFDDFVACIAAIAQGEKQ